MRRLIGVGLAWTVVLLTIFVPGASGQTGGADPATWPTPNPDPSWYYYDLGPFDDAAYRPVTIAEIVADPFQFDGQLVRVQGQYSFGLRPVPGCASRPPTRPPTVEPGFVPNSSPMSLSDPAGQLGVQVWGKQGDSFGGQDELALANGDLIELHGIVRASYQNPPCSQDTLMATAYLAIQRTDPTIPFKVPAQDIGQKQNRLPPTGIQDEVQSTTRTTP